jgi:hypothetical protein
MLRLNLGCGKELKDGYVNIDYNPVNDQVVNATFDKLPYEDSMVDEIYTCHAFEHVLLPDIDKTLMEWRRVLKSGGKLVVIVPDFAVVAKYWAKAQVEEKLRWWTYAICGSQQGPGLIHGQIHDEVTLPYILSTYGFIPTYVGHDNPEADFWLYVEAIKP